MGGPSPPWRKLPGLSAHCQPLILPNAAQVAACYNVRPLDTQPNDRLLTGREPRTLEGELRLERQGTGLEPALTILPKSPILAPLSVPQ